MAALKASSTDSKNSSIRSVAKKFGLSEATLRHAIQNNGHLKPPGRTKILSNHEEEQLTSYCLNMQKLGFGLTQSGIAQCVLDILHQNKQANPFGENGPGQAWWKRFMRDHKELSFRAPQALNEARAQRANQTIVKDHFDKLREILEKHSLTANHIWNMDETGFIIEPGLQRVIARKGSRQVHQVSCGNSHDHISVCPTISARGTYIPLLIIFKGKRMIPGLLDGAPPGSVMGFSDTGYMKESLFQMYIEHFIRSIPPACPVLLILDGHKSHVNYTSVKFCYEKTSSFIHFHHTPPMSFNLPNFPLLPSKKHTTRVVIISVPAITENWLQSIHLPRSLGKLISRHIHLQQSAMPSRLQGYGPLIPMLSALIALLLRL